eukprot:6771203-Alexandrium_andersonii.AAC.1
MALLFHLELRRGHLFFEQYALLAHLAAHVRALRILRLSSLPELLIVGEPALGDLEPSLELLGSALSLSTAPFGVAENVCTRVTSS